MFENNIINTIESNYRIIHNPMYQYKDDYGIVFITSQTYEILIRALSNLRGAREINRETERLLRSIFLHQYKNSILVKKLDSEQPRVIAQRFIGKKNIRYYIFKRDGNKCLCCESIKNLTLDHINPISKGGENKISNLQTLCRSCNSIKLTKYKYYRNGGR